MKKSLTALSVVGALLTGCTGGSSTDATNVVEEKKQNRFHALLTKNYSNGHMYLHDQNLTFGDLKELSAALHEFDTTHPIESMDLYNNKFSAFPKGFAKNLKLVKVSIDADVHTYPLLWNKIELVRG